MLLIDEKISKRAKREIKNSPFNIYFFRFLIKSSLSAQDVSENKKKYLEKEFLFINSSSYIENYFLRLIKTGVLRREVDGQGLTSKVRMTPIGRKVIKNGEDLYNQKKSMLNKIISCIKYQLTSR